MKTLTQIREASGGKEAYQKFFNSLLKKFGVDSPSELDDKKKKEFFNAIDKGWDGDNEKDESIVKEALKAGKGNIKNLDVDLDATDYDGGEKAFVKDIKKRFKVTVKITRMGALLSGKKADVMQFLMSDLYGMGEDDLEDLFPELMENSDDFKDDSDVDDDKGNYSGVDEKAKPVQGNRDEYYRRVDTVNKKFDMKPVGKRKLSDLKPAELKKYFAAVDKVMGHDESVNEDAPPGMESVVKKLKQDHSESEAFAIAWSIYNNKKHEENLDEGNVKGIFKALLSLSKQKEYKKVSKALINLTKPSPMMKDKEIAKGLNSRLTQLADKLDKNASNKLLKIANLASTYESINEGKPYPVMNASQRVKIIKIAKKHSGDMERAIKEIDRIRKNLSDNPDVMDILKKANEGVDVDCRLLGFRAAMRRKEGEKQKGSVIIDRRTKGAKEAQLRSEKSKAKREEKRKQKEFAEKYPKLDYQYGNDADLEEILHNSNRKIFGETASNCVASGNVDMAPNAGKKKKKMIRRDY